MSHIGDIVGAPSGEVAFSGHCFSTLVLGPLRLVGLCVAMNTENSDTYVQQGGPPIGGGSAKRDVTYPTATVYYY